MVTVFAQPHKAIELELAANSTSGLCSDLETRWAKKHGLARRLSWLYAISADRVRSSTWCFTFTCEIFALHVYWPSGSWGFQKLVHSFSPCTRLPSNTNQSFSHFARNYFSSKRDKIPLASMYWPSIQGYLEGHHIIWFPSCTKVTQVSNMQSPGTQVRSWPWRPFFWCRWKMKMPVSTFKSPRHMIWSAALHNNGSQPKCSFLMQKPLNLN